jgi:REP element-mobilizing transposase RayT
MSVEERIPAVLCVPLGTPYQKNKLCNFEENKKQIIMSNTYTQMHVHCVFAVQNRASLIQSNWEEELFRYITGIVNHQGHKLLSIGGIPNHLHMLIGFRPHQSLSELMKYVKGDSSKWINLKRLSHGHFSWQEGYSGFTYSKKDIHNVCHYIETQKYHHNLVAFQDEYQSILKEFDVDFDPRYILKEVS